LVGRGDNASAVAIVGVINVVYRIGSLSLLGGSQQWRQHSLKSGDQVICFSRTFRQIFDLFILDCDFGTKKSDLAVLF